LSFEFLALLAWKIKSDIVVKYIIKRIGFLSYCGRRKKKKKTDIIKPGAKQIILFIIVVAIALVTR
jgi:hypothetical protein